MAKTFKLTREQLHALAKVDRKIDPETLVMLERVLVNGESQRNVAAEFGKKQQFISDRVKNLKERLAKQTEIVPDGFEVRMVIVHKSELDALDKFEKEGLKAHA
tara:strand:+ start:5577 stop:5888 length:312 start_codon:yes stop_codon:yes gene_type:complete